MAVKMETNHTEPIEGYYIDATWRIRGQVYIEATSEAAAKQQTESLANIEQLTRVTILSCESIEEVSIDDTPDRTFLFDGGWLMRDYFITVKREHKQRAKQILNTRLQEMQEQMRKTPGILSYTQIEEYIFAGLHEANIEYITEYVQYD